MVRKTKEEAKATRSCILDAAERLFQERGVAATSLQQIAAAAGVTRGAVYWHFHDKADLFDAMIQRVVLPMETEASPLLEGADGDPLGRLREHLAVLLRHFSGNEQMRRVFDIAVNRVEYVGELAEARERKQASRRAYLERLRGVMAAAQRRGQLAPGLDPETATAGLFALVDGLIRGWAENPSGCRLDEGGLAVIDIYLAGLTTKPPA